MQFLAEYGLFLIKVVTLVAAILFVLSGIFSLSQKGKGKQKGSIKINHLNEKISELKDSLQKKILSKEAYKKHTKADKAARKKQAKQDNNTNKKRLYTIKFKGDIQAKSVHSLREEITAILLVANKEDEVLVQVESPGGAVNGYGLAASQLQRIRDKGIKLTVAIDKVAASGGYMMASVADTILAAPFAIVGSIGVIASLPNFHRLLKKNDIDFEQITAGKYKRTLTLFGENTDDKREKFQQDIEDVHTLFQEHIKHFRSQLDMEKVATGEYWFGKRALELNLVDQLITSDDYLLNANDTCDIYQIEYAQKKTLAHKIAKTAQMTVDTCLFSWWQKAESSRFMS